MDQTRPKKGYGDEFQDHHRGDYGSGINLCGYTRSWLMSISAVPWIHSGSFPSRQLSNIEAGGNFRAARRIRIHNITISP